MTIKEIIKISAFLLNRKEVTDHLQNGDSHSQDVQMLETINVFTELANLVINELASTYIPMVKSEVVTSDSGKIYYNKLSETPLRIISVEKSDGSKLSFKVHHEYLVVNGDDVTVEYEYLPSNYGLNDNIGYTDKDVTARVISYGLCAEFSIHEGNFEQAVLWHKRYVDAISEICVPENSRIKARSFV